MTSSFHLSDFFTFPKEYIMNVLSDVDFGRISENVFNQKTV
jgi:hypothetical protein